MLALVLMTITKAESITQEQALEQARSFMQQREASGSRMRRAPGVQLRLSPTRQIAGLYVFNVADNGGFVIVSNDDRTLPVLGFSDSGNIDPDNIPAGMRAWLKGYADEIAWAIEHNITNTAAARGQHRVGSHSTSAIEPLITTKWDQDSPYNDLCPLFNEAACATGCVATAMAQVMYCTEKRVGNNTTTTTVGIPAYTTYSNNIPMSAIPAGTDIDWSAMTDTYDNNSTTAASQAVAQLMLYCGCSVEMNYGPASSASTNAAATALKTYFGYNNTTTYVHRSSYTSDNWADLIYFELDHNRPVLYDGQSSDGGHAFVCDGYMYENGTDLFHINWGWGGQSDGYFVLSALDPEQEGIGGSSSGDGYNTDQGAVIGIQKSDESGAMSTIKPSAISLKLNSMTLSTTEIATNDQMTFTLNITNQSEDDLENNTIYVGWAEGNQADFLAGDYFTIPAGQTKDCVISYTPNKAGTYNLIFWSPNDQGSFTTDGYVWAKLYVVEPGTPINLTASNISSTSAALSWTATGTVNSYKVRYRTMATGFQDDFETGLDSWTESGWGRYKGNTHSGTFVAGAMSQGLDADNWLITPLVSLGGTLSFWEYTYPQKDSYEVLLSTTGTDIADFTTTLRSLAEASNGWKETSIDLSAYAGQKGYIAIHHKCSNKSYLLIDDFTIGTIAPAGDWIEKTTTTTSTTITDLTPSTDYEYQAIGIKGNSQLTSPNMASFTTMISTGSDDTVDLTVRDGDVLTGTVGANTRITIEDGATVTLSNADITNISTSNDWAGITCLGDATIILEGENKVKGGSCQYPGIQVGPAGKTLTIMGDGSLDVSTNSDESTLCGAAIGCAANGTCGNIVISGGTITATGGYGAAAIGSGAEGTCGNITIDGGTITAYGGENAPGVGCGPLAQCGDINIGDNIDVEPITNGCIYTVVIKYPVWVCGTQVNEKNANDVLGDGSVSYTPGEGTGTLTFTSATQTTSSEGYGKIYASGIDLTINAANGITIESDEMGICVNGDNKTLTINGNVNINSKSGCLNAFNIKLNGTENVIQSTEGPCVTAEGTLDITGKLTATSADNFPAIMTLGVISIPKDYEIIEPENGQIKEYSIQNNSFNTIVDAEGMYAYHVVIGPHVHRISTIFAVMPTCTEPGHTESTVCSVCGLIITEAMEIPPLGHIWGEWVVTREPEPGKPGEETRTCMNDPSHKETRPIYSVEFTAPTAKENLVYNGEAQALIEAGTAEGGEMQYSMDNETWSTDIPTATEAGEYTVYYKVVGDSSHKGIEAQSITVTIAMPNSVTTIARDTDDNNWYDTNGHKLNGKPTKKGLYINNSRKVTVK